MAKRAVETILVRVKPRTKKNGSKLVRRHCAMGFNIEAGGGWYKFPKTTLHDGRTIDVEAYFRNVRVDDTDPDSDLACDVATPEEAAAIEKKENEADRIAASATNPHTLGAAAQPRGEGGDFGSSDLRRKQVDADESEAPAKAKRGRPRKQAETPAE